jgi:4'-phosphopantetheinyl transferase EntD
VTRTLISRLFDEQVIALEANPSELGPRADVFDEERAAVARAVEKRRLEYFATRHLAHQAFAALGVPVVPLLNNADRSPCWPAGVVGSLTHTAGWCGVAVTRAGGECIGLGVDAERVYDMNIEVARRVLTKHEFDALAGWALGELQERATLIFSAKEAVYKCLFPLVKRYIGFDEVEISVARVSAGEFQFRAVSERLHAECVNSRARWSARFERQDNLWLTGVTMFRDGGADDVRD